MGRLCSTPVFAAWWLFFNFPPCTGHAAPLGQVCSLLGRPGLFCLSQPGCCAGTGVVLGQGCCSAPCARGCRWPWGSRVTTVTALRIRLLFWGWLQLSLASIRAPSLAGSAAARCLSPAPPAPLRCIWKALSPKEFSVLNPL